MFPARYGRVTADKSMYTTVVIDIYSRGGGSGATGSGETEGCEICGEGEAGRGTRGG